MNSFLPLWPEPAALLGLALVHFLWQGALIAAVLAAALRLTRARPAALRHDLACLALLLMLLAPVLTLVLLDGSADTLSAGPGGSTGPSDVTAPVREAMPLAATPPSWLAVLAAAWVLGVLVLGLRLAGGWWQVVRLAGRGTIPAPTIWQERLRELQFRLHLRRRIRLAESPCVQAPLLVGWLRPVILLPLGLLTGLPAAQVEAILLHELAHVRGHDFLINLVQRFAETLLFYHPAVWWVSEQVRREREHRCDDAAAAAMGEGRTLADALLTLAERRPDAPALALAADGGSLADRIRRLLGAPISSSPAAGRAWRWGLLALVLIGLGIWLVPQWTAPRLYQSTARIRIESPLMVGGASYDPYFLVTQLEVLRSSSLLQQVIAEQGLEKHWGMNASGALQRLQERLKVRQYRNTALVEITVASEKPEEAAEIANAVARKAAQLRQRSREEQDHVQRAVDRAGIERLDALIELTDAKLRDLATPSSPAGNWKPLADELRMLRDLKLQKQREQILKELEPRPDDEAIEIIDAAVPGLRPVRWQASAR